MAKRESKGPTTDQVGDLVITGDRLGVGTTEQLSTLTVRARPGFTLTGTVFSTTGSTTVTGTGTLFLSELSVGDIITTGGSYDNVKGVVAIASDTSLTVDSPYISGDTETDVPALPSAARFDDGSGTPQFSVNGNGNVGIGTTGARGQLEVFGVGAGNYNACPVGVRIHNTQASDAWQLVLSADSGTTEPGVLMSVLADGNSQASMTISTFDGNESDNAVDMVRIDGGGLHLLAGFSTGVSMIELDYTVDPQAQHLIVYAGLNGLTITLPAAGYCDGRMLSIVKVDGAGFVTVAAAGGDVINGAATKVIAGMYEGIQLVSTGSNLWLAHALTPV